MRKLHEIIKDRWQAEKRHHNLFFDIVSADKLYSSARNDILDLLAAIANQEARLTALEQRIKGLHAALAECQAQAAALARADGLTVDTHDVFLVREAANLFETVANDFIKVDSIKTTFLERAAFLKLLAGRIEQAAQLARADSLTAAEYDDLINLCRNAEFTNNTPSIRQRYHRLAEKMIEQQRTSNNREGEAKNG